VSKHSGKGREWHARVFGESAYVCEAETHSPLCDGMAREAHHIVYRSHLTEPALWIVENGIALSRECHALAHASHNANLPDYRLRAAVNAVNKVQGDRPEFRIQPFYKKQLT
jgi:hypothetical protein